MKGFLLTSILTAVSVLACSPGPVRQEWRQLSSGQQQAYLNAINQLNQRQDDTSNDSTDPATWSFAHFAIVHARYQQANHNQGSVQAPPFFAWHRIFLHYYEKALQSIDSSVVLPYWDWTQDSQNPLSSDVYAQLGGNGQGASGCMETNPLNGWSSAVNGGCLKRCSGAGQTLYPAGAVVSLMNGSPNYAALNRQIQDGPHGAVHNVIGGRCADGGVGDMYTMSSAGDPIFYMHHAMVDKIWMMWQDACPSKFANDYSAAVNSVMAPFTQTAQDVLNFKASDGNFCYGYSSSGINSVQLNKCAGAPGTPTQSGDSAAPSATAPADSVDQYFAELRLLDLIPNSADILKALFPGFSNSNINTISHFMHSPASKAKAKRDYLSYGNFTSVPDVIPTYQLNPGYKIKAPCQNDTTDLYNLRHPTPLDKDYIKMMNVDEKSARHVEYLAKLAVDDMNNMEGYVPYSALINFNAHNKLGLFKPKQSN
ncbi:hypothetical protein HK103_007541 [Boothiomyces macroporosus]|uniref:Tyrosinase copper-binding domain-containing protein n=1 Tax=Boothiomyces macroporosus TaxID=261099 RepID=A0AAD5Y5W4_9FUNG|nr:hypothetical protein HK103_007541 [Boothiomyces macroporosus]